MEQIFDTTQLTVEHLIEEIDVGKLGLSYIQRHFLWPDEKVRDMFDSMLHGYPLGYLMLWECPESEGNKVIGVGTKSYKYPKEVIIDGQQRLTSLYAVMKGEKVVDDKFKEREIIISFNPITNKFGVGASHRTPEWIYNISKLFTSSTAFQCIQDFLSGLAKYRAENREELSNEERDKAVRNIEAVFNIKKYVFSVVTIKASADEEAVSQIFIRINSSGTPLKQNDFVITLLSMYSEQSRKEIEEFCIQSRTPSAGKATSYNSIGIEIFPSDIVRTIVAYAFDRSDPAAAYKLLRGTDLEKKGTSISIELREKNLEIFREKSADVLNVDNWHDFLKAIMNAGYIDKRIILSRTALFNSYAMFLIAKYRFHAPHNTCMNLTSLWFFYAALTSLYSGPSESTFANNLNLIKTCTTIEDYQSFIYSEINARLTDDYFDVTLASTSGSTNNAWCAYVASLNILGTKTLFSKNHLPLSKFFEPGSDGTRKALEKHHLFPRAYLKDFGYSNTQINQTANYAFIDWNNNAKILDEAPAKYYPIICQGMTHDEILQMEDDNALPHGWENMSYDDFLVERRILMAQIIKRAFEILKSRA